MCLFQVINDNNRADISIMASITLITEVQNDWADMTRLWCLIRLFRQDAANDKWLKGEQVLTVGKKKDRRVGLWG